MKPYKFPLLFVLLISFIPCFAFMIVDDDLPDDNQKVVLVVGQENAHESNQDFVAFANQLNTSYSILDREELPIYNDAVDLHSQYHLTNPTKAITVKDLSRNINPFRFPLKSNRNFIASNLQPDSKQKA